MYSSGPTSGTVGPSPAPLPLLAMTGDHVVAAAGGHAITLHVGMSVCELRDRMREDPLSAG